MKKIFNCLLQICIVFSISINCFANDTIYVATGEYPPYVSEDLVQYGISSRNVTEAFKLSNIDVIYEFYPFGRAFDLVKRGEKDVTFPWFHNAERAKHFYYSDPIFFEDLHIFHLKSYKFDWNNIDDLKGIDIGTMISYSYGKDFDEAAKANKLLIQPVIDNEINFQKLLKGRIDIYPVNLEVGLSVLKNKFTEEQRKLITYHPKAMLTEPLFLLFSKKNPENIERVKAFNKGLKQLKINIQLPDKNSSTQLNGNLENTNIE